MAFDISSLIGGNIADAVAKIISLFKVDPTVALQSQAELTKIQLGLQQELIQQVTDQIEVNKVEAASSKTFVAGWRPFIGWICGSAFGYVYIVQPLLGFILAAFHHPVTLPAIDLGGMMPVVLGMLGLAAGQHYENVQISKNSGGNGN